MPDDVVSAVATETTTDTQDTTSQSTPQAGDVESATTPKEPTKNGKPPLKVPENLKPKANDQERFKGRISELVHSRKALEEEARQLRNELALLKGGKQESQPTRTNTDSPPNPDEFDKYQDYVDALVDYKVSQREKTQRQQQSEESYRQYQHEKRQEFEQHAAEIVSQVPEFWDAVTDPSLPVTDAMAEAVMELGPLAPYTMLWLASNRQEAMKMSKLPPRAATIAIGKLAVQLERDLSDAGTDHSTSSAPAAPQFQPKPVPQIRGGSPGNLNDGPSDKDDARTWMIKEAERQRKKFGNQNLRVYVPR